jgi:antitoxin component YwqK of YwqJK toxin-antitoxin module
MRSAFVILITFILLNPSIFSQELYIKDVTNLNLDTVYSTVDLNLSTGTIYDHYENGMIKLLVVYSKGLKNGEIKKWHSNGQLIYKGYFINGIENGVFEEFDIYGKKLSKVKYKDGVILWEIDFSEKYR